MEETRNENGQKNNNEIVHERKQGILVEHVYKSFGKEHVLVDVNLEIPPGKIYGVVGNNGSGKTVLMKCICGFMHPDKGQIHVGGSRVGKECDFPDKLGVIIETLQRVGLNPKMKKPVAKYSLGMRQRLGIAQAIMENPDVLILDEPFNGLDKAGVAEMRQLLLSLKESGKAIMLASHNAQDIEMLCDYVHEMEDWK